MIVSSERKGIPTEPSVETSRDNFPGFSRIVREGAVPVNGNRHGSLQSGSGRPQARPGVAADRFTLRLLLGPLGYP